MSSGQYCRQAFSSDGNENEKRIRRQEWVNASEFEFYRLKPSEYVYVTPNLEWSLVSKGCTPTSTLPTSQREMDFNLDVLVNVEQSFYDEGYADGFAHGRIHGLIEGRALGGEKGYEMWEEIGFYEGFTLLWKDTIGKGIVNNERASLHISHLLEMIERFPKANLPTADSSELDIPKLFRQIRSRYKALCAVLGIRPTLRATSAPSSQEDADELGDSTSITSSGVAKKKVWPAAIPDRSPSGPDLSF